MDKLKGLSRDFFHYVFKEYSGVTFIVVIIAIILIVGNSCGCFK